MAQRVLSQDRSGWSADPWGADLQERLEEVSLTGMGACGEKRGEEGILQRGSCPPPHLVKVP